MAAVNLLIGVGGTGAKVVEAALFSFLAGFGPRDVSVAFVDQDEANGNVRRARELLRQLEQLRGLWTAGGRPDRWDAASPVTEGGSLLASVAARSIDPAHDLWAPHAEEGTTLGSIFSANVLAREEPRLKSLMDALYTPGPSEQGMELSEGYRGRPHIGAAAILSRAEQDAPFWRSLQEILRRAQGGQEVRVFLIGSVFGGTGAAGFPTLARTLRDMARSATGQAPNVRVGGALMLPYFGFAPPPDEGANVARPEHLLRQSRAALKYYHDLFRREHVFDELYLTGWNPPFQLGYYAPGSNAQANPPLLPELIAAASAVRFFDAARARPEGGENPTYISARNAPDAFGWSDIPAVEPGREAEPYEKLGQLLRFCAAWRNTVRPSLRSRMFGGDPWYHKQGAKQVKYDRPETLQNLKALDETVERVLEWAAAMQVFATTSEFGPPGVPRFDLWDVFSMATFSPRADPTHPVALRPPLTGDAALNAYRRIVSARDEVSQPPDQSALFNEINVAARPGAHEGLGRIVAAVHHAARLTDTAAGRAAR